MFSIRETPERIRGNPVTFGNKTGGLYVLAKRISPGPGLMLYDYRIYRKQERLLILFEVFGDNRE